MSYVNTWILILVMAKYLLKDQPSCMNRNMENKYLEVLESDEKQVYTEEESPLGRRKL